MANQGDRRNVDSHFKDLATTIFYPKITFTDFPIIFLGKLADTTNDIDKFNKNDIAHSLVSMFAYNILNASIQACLNEKVKNVSLKFTLNKSFTIMSHYHAFNILTPIYHEPL